MRSLRGLSGAHEIRLRLRIWADGRGCSGQKKISQKMTTSSVGSKSTEGLVSL